MVKTTNVKKHVLSDIFEANMGYLKKLIEFIKQLSSVDTKGFELEYTDLWLAYEHDKDEIIMPYFTDHKYVKYKVGDVVAVAKKGNMVAFYKIHTIKKGGSSYGDYASWDDNKLYSLTFDHIVYYT